MRRTTPEHLETTRRKLPHWQIGGSVYFVTFTTKRAVLSPEDRSVVLETIQRGADMHFRLILAVIMPDHVHLLIQPRELVTGIWDNLGKVLKSIKGTSSRQINRRHNRKGSLWLAESYDHIVRDEAELLEKYQYIIQNPVKARIVGTPEEYPFFVFPPEDSKSPS